MRKASFALFLVAAIAVAVFALSVPFIFGVCEWQESDDGQEFLLSKISENLQPRKCQQIDSENGKSNKHDCPPVANSDGKISAIKDSRRASLNDDDEKIKSVTSAAAGKKGPDESSDVNDMGNEETLKNIRKPPVGHLKKLGEHGSIIIEREIEELDYVLDGKDFYEHFLRKRRPLILRGAVKEWPAVQRWSNESYLKEKYGATVFDVQFSKTYEGEFPVKRTMSLTDYLNIYKTKDVYLDCPFIHSEMIGDILIPHCLQCNEILDSIGSAHLLFSSGNTSSSCHFDGYENLLSVIAGTKEILVADPKYVELFYSQNHTTVNIESPIDPEAVDLEKFPRIAEIPFHKVVLNAGDILYIPQTWWHHVRSFDCPNIAISLWFHPFPERDDQPSDNSEANMDFQEDMIMVTKEFQKTVMTYPETIECKSQNKPITEVFSPNFEAWNFAKEVDPDDLHINLISGYKMPKIGLGTAGLFEDTKSVVLAALNAGYRMVDSAQAYDEEAVGDALRETTVPREDIFIVSKVHPRFLGYNETLKSVEESLQKLKVAYIDLMLIHSMDCDEGPGMHLVCQKGEPKGSWEDSWKALEELITRGEIRSIGVSNFEVPDLQRLLSFALKPISVVQNFFDPFNQDHETRYFCAQRKIRYMGYSTLGDSWVREGLKDNPVLTDEGLQKIGEKFDASIAQVVITWALGNDVIQIPRSRNLNHIQTNFRLSHVKLDDEDRQYIDELDGKLQLPDEPSEATSMRTNESGSAREDSDEEDSEGDETAAEIKAPVRDPTIIDKVFLERKVDLSVATIFLSSDDQWIYSLDTATGKLNWKYGTAEDGGSTCAFSLDGTIVHCGTDDSYMRALKAEDGSLIWKFKTNGPVTSSPRVDPDGALYFGGVDGHFYVLNSDGSVKWKKFLGGEIWSSPALRDDGRQIFIATMGEDAPNTFALDGKTGTIIWKRHIGPLMISSPTLSLDSKTVFFCSLDSNCYAFDADDGKEIWVFEADSGFHSSPAVSKSDGTLYVGSSEGNIYALDSTNGKLKWVKQGKGELMSSPFVSPDGRLYITSAVGEMLALDPSDGKLIWKFKSEGSSIWSSPRLATDGLLFVGGIDTYVYALNSSDGSMMWRFKTNGPIVGTPLITSAFAVPQA